MFEKEAEDKAFEKYPLSDRCDRIDLERNLKYEEGFKDGAEFGYHKANEWHYPSKGEYPKVEDEYLVIFESDRTKYKGLESYYPDTKKLYSQRRVKHDPRLFIRTNHRTS